MDYRFPCPLYERGDEKDALESIYEYLYGKDRYIDFAFDNIGYTATVPKEVEDVIKRMITRQYGDNIITMANFLSVQNLFFNKYKDTILKYLYFTRGNRNARFDMMRIQDISNLIIINQFLKEKDKSPYFHWDPNTIWTDFDMGDNVKRNIMNPLNIFYTVDLIIPHNNDTDFIHYLNRHTEFKFNEDKDTENSFTIKIQLLPACNPVPLITLTKAIFRYF